MSKKKDPLPALSGVLPHLADAGSRLRGESDVH
jgi:hypothetical protein